MKKTRILIADDHDVVRHGLRPLIEAEWGWEICAEAENGREAVALALKCRPDVVVLDVAMPELNGVEATRQIRQALPETEVLVLTGQESEALVGQLLDAGARGYLFKTHAGEQLVPAIKALLRGETYFAPGVAEMVLAGYLKGGRGAAPATPGGLSPREREIVQLLGEGKSNKEVGEALGISVKTAETHRANIMRKLGFKAFSELVRFAVRNHIVQP